MLCIKCKAKEAQIKHPNGDFCGDCFIDMLVSRIKKEAKFSKGDKVLVYGKLAKEFLGRVIGDLPLEIVESDESFSKKVLYEDFPKYDKVVIPWTADDEARLFYEEITKSNPSFEGIGKSVKMIKIFRPIMNKELLQAAKVLNIEFNPDKDDKNLEKISKKYPSSKFGLIKTAEEFKKALDDERERIG